MEAKGTKLLSFTLFVLIGSLCFFSNRENRAPPFFRVLLHYCVNRTNLITKSAAMQLDASVDSTFNTTLGSESLDNGQSLEVRD